MATKVGSPRFNIWGVPMFNDAELRKLDREIRKLTCPVLGCRADSGEPCQERGKPIKNHHMDRLPQGFDIAVAVWGEAAVKGKIGMVDYEYRIRPNGDKIAILPASHFETLFHATERLTFIEERHDERCGCKGEACDLGSDLAEFDLLHKRE